MNAVRTQDKIFSDWDKEPENKRHDALAMMQDKMRETHGISPEITGIVSTAWFAYFRQIKFGAGLEGLLQEIGDLKWSNHGTMYRNAKGKLGMRGKPKTPITQEETDGQNT